MKCKIAMFGGTFNPIHNGHFNLAKELTTILALQRLLLIPCHIPAHRELPNVTCKERAFMLQAAIGRDPSLTVDLRELQRGGTSYSIDTLISLRAEYGEHCSLSMVVGCDAYLNLMRWHQWPRLLDYAHIIVAARPGWRMPVAGALAEYTKTHNADVQALDKKANGSIVQVNTEEYDISSTAIRSLITKNMSIEHLVPTVVEKYIQENGLYTL